MHRFDKTHGFEPCVLYAWFCFLYAWFLYAWFFARTVLFFVRTVSFFVRTVLFLLRTVSNHSTDTTRNTNKYMCHLSMDKCEVYWFLVYS
jgi:hypothetical protein